MLHHQTLEFAHDDSMQIIVRKKAAKKILNFLRVCRAVRENYEIQFKSVLLRSVYMIQRQFRRIRIKRRVERLEIYRASIYLDTKTSLLSLIEADQTIESVEIFGEFTVNQKQKAWDRKIKCIRCDDNSDLFSVQIDIKIGQKFKFIINNGRSYAVSDHYKRVSDGQGDLNNVFQFHDRRIISTPTTNQKKSIPFLQNARAPQQLDQFVSESDVKFREQKISISQTKEEEVLLVSQQEKLNNLLLPNKDSYLKYQSQANILANADMLTCSAAFADYSINSPKSSVSLQQDTLFVSSEIEAQEKLFSSSSPNLIESLNWQNQLLDETATTRRCQAVYDANQFCMIMPQRGAASHHHQDYEISSSSQSCSSGSLQDIEASGIVDWIDGRGFHKHDQPKTSSSSLAIISGAHSIAKNHEDSNEDAFFTSERSFGVADGVGGWQDMGFSSQAFSRQLMENCRLEIENFDQESKLLIRQRTDQAAATNNEGKSAQFITLELLDFNPETKNAPENCKSDQEINQVWSFDGIGIYNNEVGGQDQDTKYILERAMAKITAVGSSTAVIAVLNSSNLLQISNLGDSGFLHYRQRECKLIQQQQQQFNASESDQEQIIGKTSLQTRSKAQTHSFNIPYQMCKLPNESHIEDLRTQGKTQQLSRLQTMLNQDGQSVCNDHPSDADMHEIKLSLGDVIVTATDGVLDNLFNREIIQIIKTYKQERYSEKRHNSNDFPCQLNQPQEAMELARRICLAARAKVDDTGLNKKVETPYQRVYKKTYSSGWDGGKEDDITAVVTLVVTKPITQ